MKPRSKTFLEIGAGEEASRHLMPKIRSGDRYIAVDMRPLTYPYIARSHVSRVKNLFTRADAFSLPVKANSVDHVVSRNMITDLGFPIIFSPVAISFRDALQKIEAELHRVTRKGATVTFHEHYTPSVLEYKEGELGEEDGLSRLEHFKAVFSRRWKIKHDQLPRGFADMHDGVVIKLFKK
ncbi:methyltransferase domain-containing protein [Candidatus Micrarchaeota archaeon]|nr:methyltransferase domain-containing protein [Candidatus Micrarchaeota archaeon]